jgi:membrane protease YdiL (CAAX protease family)
MSLNAAAAIATIWFAAAHAYQGTQGVFFIALLSVALMALYLWSGSLLAPMLLHAFIDIYAGLVGYRLFTGRSD